VATRPLALIIWILIAGLTTAVAHLCWNRQSNSAQVLTSPARPAPAERSVSLRADSKAKNSVLPAVSPTPHSNVLKIANSFPDGGGFNWDKGSGTPEEIRFSGQRILSKAKQGTYCCGFTFAVVMRAAKEAGLLEGKSVSQIRKFQQHWYAATPEAREKQQIYALKWLGIGKEVPLLAAQSGDFIRLWHGGSGHSVILVRWIVENGKQVGLEYRGTQGSTDGVGNRIEYVPGAPGHENGDFIPDRTYAGRLSIPVGRASTTSLDTLLRKSPRFQELLRVSPHPGYMIDSETKDYWELGMGDNMDDHFAKWENLRVWKTGLIEKLNGTAEWVLEFRP
jgi:hypothetical protein